MSFFDMLRSDPPPTPRSDPPPTPRAINKNALTWVDEKKIENLLVYMVKKAKPHQEGGGVFVGSIRHKIRELRLSGTIYKQLYSLGIDRSGRGKTAVWSIPESLYLKYSINEEPPAPKAVEEALETLDTDIRVGMTVRLKSGGPAMTVEGVENGKIRCVWFNEIENLYRNKFDSTVLKIY